MGKTKAQIEAEREQQLKEKEIKYKELKRKYDNDFYFNLGKHEKIKEIKNILEII